MLKKPKRYTVVLLYPDHMTDDYGTDTYIAWVKAISPSNAVLKAQEQAIRAQGEDVDPENPINPDDFEALVAYRGWLKSVV